MSLMASKNDLIAAYFSQWADTEDDSIRENFESVKPNTGLTYMNGRYQHHSNI